MLSFYKLPFCLFLNVKEFYFIYNPNTFKGILVTIDDIGMCVPVGILDFHFLKIRIYTNKWNLEDLNYQLLYIITANQYKIPDFLFDYSKAIEFLNDKSNVLMDPAATVK